MPAAPEGVAAPAPGLTFEPEGGRAGMAAGFIARGPGYAARFSPAGAHIALRGAGGEAGIGLRLVGANEHAAGAGRGRILGWSHYYMGSDPAAWREDVPNYPRIEYAAVYPGVDLAWHGAQGALEFDFIVAPGADPHRIHLAFDGAESLRLAPSGELVLATAAGELRFARPLAWQEHAGRREAVAAAFELAGVGDGVRFRLGPYDPARPLVIDPIITYADYLGGSADDAGLAIAVDADGNRYVAGSTASVDFPGAVKPLNTGTDVFVAKLDPGGARLYTVFVGGFGTDVPNAIVVDGNGRAHVAGRTDSTNMPVTAAAAQPALGGDQDGFVVRLTANGALDYLTYLGGSGQDTARAIALNPAGDIYVGGDTRSEDFPVEAPLQAALAGTGDGIVARISSLGGLMYATYLGGLGPDGVSSLALDSAGGIYVGGATGSEDFPTAGDSGPYQVSFRGGGTDGFVARLAANGATLEYSTYLGGSGSDGVLALAVGSVEGVDGFAYVTGFTSSTNFRVSPGTPVYRGGTFDAFVTRLIPNGSVADYSSFLGGDGEDQGVAIALTGESRVVIAGSTQSGNLGLTQPVQVQRLGSRDGYVLQLQFAAEGVISQLFSTYLGGLGDDAVTGVAVDAAGNLHVAGSGTSVNLPTVLATQGGNAGGRDAFVMRIARDPAQPLPDLRVDIEADPMPVPRRRNLTYEVTIANEGVGGASGVLVQLDGVNVSSIASPGVSCQPVAGVSVLCPVGAINALGARSLEVRATTDEIGPATLSATLVRADQSGISVGNNSASLERLVVDDSDKSAGLGWELIALLGMSWLVRRERRSSVVTGLRAESRPS